MKTLTKLALIAVLLTTAAAAQAEWVRGNFRSNGTYVAPYYRTPANGLPYDNLSYRGYPSQQPGYVSPRSYDYGYTPTPPSLDLGLSRPKTLPHYEDYGLGSRVTPLGGNVWTKSSSHRSSAWGLGF